MANRRKVKRELSFFLETDRDVRMSDVLHAMLKGVGLDASRGINPYGHGRFAITVSSKKVAEALEGKGMLEVKGRNYPLVPCERNTKTVSLHFLPIEVPNEDVEEELRKYGQVISVKRDYFQEAPTVERGSRRAVMVMEREVPNFIDIDGFQTMCVYSGMKKSCRRCGQTGHFSFDCKTEYCGRCSVYGHSSRGCKEPCKKCGASHATSSCTVKSYASVTSEVVKNRQGEEAFEEAAVGDGAKTTGEGDTRKDESSTADEEDSALASTSPERTGGPRPREGSEEEGEENRSLTSSTEEAELEVDSDKEDNDTVTENEKPEDMDEGNVVASGIKRPHSIGTTSTTQSESSARHELPGQLSSLPQRGRGVVKKKRDS